MTMSSIEQRFGVNREVTSLSGFLMAAEEVGLDTHTGLQDDKHPLMMQSYRALKGKHGDSDLPSVMESVNGPHAEKFRMAMDAEITSLEAKQAWEVVERSSMPPGMKAVPDTWAQRIKWKPSGELNKFATGAVPHFPLQSLSTTWLSKDVSRDSQCPRNH
jgi:hypothetical protein